MEVYFSPYQLTPIRKANHLGDLTPKAGVYLKTGNKESEIADYFPHVSLGDRPVEEFLSTFPNLANAYHRSILAQLKTKKMPLPEAKFNNHELWYQGAQVDSPVIKFKIMHKDDEIPEPILRSHCRIRLDANGIFEGQDIFKFLAKLTVQQISRIDYIEDPSRLTSWSNIPIPTAQDFIEGHEFQTLIYKPNRSYLAKLPQKTIFSGYMGSSLGTLHAYKELIHRGDLSEHHGLLTPGIYAEQTSLFKGDYLSGFFPDQKAIKIYLESLLDQPWRYLCSI